MGPLSSLRIPRVRTYFGSRSLPLCFTYMTLTSYGRPSHAVRLHSVLLSPVHNPNGISTIGLANLSLSLAATRKISFDFSSSAYLDVSVRRVPRITLWIHVMLTELSFSGVAPFGYPRISAYLQLPAAFRSLSRPSSASDAKAFSLRSS